MTTANGKSSIKARDGNGRAIRSVETVAQDRECAELRSTSMSLAQIAERMGIDISTVSRAIDRGLRDLATSEEVIEARRLELMKLDRRERLLNVILSAEHVMVDHGRVIRDNKGNVLMDPRPAIAASNALDRVARHRSRLMGLEAPTKIRVETVTESEVDAELRRLAERHDLTARLAEVGLEPVLPGAD